MQKEFSKWTLEAIRSEGIAMSWLEEHRAEWCLLLAPMLKALLNGRTFVLLTDDDRSWFELYMLKNLNAVGLSRPLLPFVSLKSLYPRLDELDSKESIMLLEDMLSITFPNGYVYFYIGKSADRRAQIPKLSDNSYMWLFDEQVQNSFFLSSIDKNLDTKLITLFKLFNKSVSAALFAQIEI